MDWFNFSWFNRSYDESADFVSNTVNPNQNTMEHRLGILGNKNTDDDDGDFDNELYICKNSKYFRLKVIFKIIIITSIFSILF